MATTYSFAMMLMMVTMALAKEPVGIRIKDPNAVISFGNPPDIHIRRYPDPRDKSRVALQVETQFIQIAGPKNAPKASVSLHGDLVLNGQSLTYTLMDLNKRLIQVATTVNAIALKTKVTGVAKLPVEGWKQKSGENKPEAQCAKLSVSQCKTTKLPCSWDNGKCMMKKPDPCAQFKADVCEKQKKVPCAYDAKAKKCMMKKPAGKTTGKPGQKGKTTGKPGQKGKTTGKPGQKGKTTPKKGGGDKKGGSAGGKGKK